MWTAAHHMAAVQGCEDRGCGAPPMPPARKIPGITAPDTHPGACVDCHIVYKEMNLDARFSTLVKGWAT